jgi:hypothetical protein
VFISLYVQIVVACCFLNGATAEEREGKQILLPAAANFPVYYYASGRPAFVNAGETPTGTDARVSSKLLSSPGELKSVLKQVFKLSDI